MNLIEEGNNIELQFEKRGGILPVTVQEYTTGDILMMASVNQVAFEYTLKHKKAAFWSTSRNELWVKGLSSGNTLTIKEILVDCDQDAVIYLVSIDKGGACHTFNKFGENRKGCFYRKVDLTENKLVFIEP